MAGIATISQTPFSLAEIKRLVGRDDAVVLDIGSNDGTHTNQFLRLFPQGVIYAFEPDPRAIAKWRRSVENPRAELFEGALGALNGEADFHTSTGQRPGHENDPRFKDGFDASGSLRRPKTHLEVWPWVRFEKTIRVAVRTLDAWAEERALDRIDLIWADVQGAEGDLIKGGRRTLAKTRFFYTEFSNEEWYEGQVTLDQMTDLLGAQFELGAVWPMDALFRNKAFASGALSSAGAG